MKNVIKRVFTVMVCAAVLSVSVIALPVTSATTVHAADKTTTAALKKEFDATFYANKYADVKAAFGTNTDKLFNHFIKYGMKEGRMMNAGFDPIAYVEAYPDVKATLTKGDYSKAYEHYVTFGKKEGRNLTTNEAIGKKKAASAPKQTSTSYHISLNHNLSVSVSENQYRSCTIKIYKSNDGYGAYIDGNCYDTSGNFNSGSCYHYSTVSVNNGNWSENVHSQPQQQQTVQSAPAPAPAPTPAPQPDPTPEPDDDEDLTEEDTEAIYTLMFLAFISEYDELNEKHNNGELNDSEFEAAVAALRAEYGIYE